MSHTVKHQMPDMKDPGTLARAFNRLGWEVKMNTKCRTWHTNPDRDKVYQWVAKNPSQYGYDLGIVQDADGRLSIEGDTTMMDADVWLALGHDFDKVKQQYSTLTVMDWAESQHGSVSASLMDNGIMAMEVEVDIDA